MVLEITKPPPQPYQNHTQPPQPQTRWVAPRNRNQGYGQGGPGQDGSGMMGMVGVGNSGPQTSASQGPGAESHPVLDKLRTLNCKYHANNVRLMIKWH